MTASAANGEPVTAGRDARTGLPIYSLYGNIRNASKAKEFTTTWPYPQPPKGTVSYFHASRITHYESEYGKPKTALLDCGACF